MLNFMMGLLNIKEPEETKVESNVDAAKQAFRMMENSIGKWFTWMNETCDLSINDDDKYKFRDMMNDYAKLKNLFIGMAKRQDEFETQFKMMEGNIKDIQSKMDVLCDRMLTINRNTEKLLKQSRTEEE